MRNIKCENESMSQLDDFREQLRSARPVEEEKEQPKEEVQIVPVPKRARRKKEANSEFASAWLPKEVKRKAKLLALWIEVEGIDGPGTIGDIVAEALDVLIATKYPRARRYVEMK